MSDPAIVNWIRGKKIDQKLLGRLKTTLRGAEALLNDAERRQIKEGPVKVWLDDLKDALYEADDFLDEITTKAATHKDPGNFLSRFLNMKDREMVASMEDVIGRLESIGQRQGRHCRLVGMGGIGKTTLAQLVYNDDRVQQKFNVKAWVCVGEEFNVLKVTKMVIEEVTSKSCEMNGLNSVQHLRNVLTGKSFLVVLDDMWSNHYDDWKTFLNAFQYGSQGGKILVTTRIDTVASMVKTIPAHNLSLLDAEQCWLVFANHAFFPTESRNRLALEKIGRKIVRKVQRPAIGCSITNMDKMDGKFVLVLISLKT
ncbi:putative disease resistance RPP13-like protein 1 [Arachis hypogaea]|uniref:putative disease resistance RPP13-like protein 1 n=1 Tax=Arachis hypogaea TaxID=3818 RepID=UPI0007AF3629|nr:putative disease resistance protein RGA3 [Arachis hypogaea]